MNCIRGRCELAGVAGLGYDLRKCEAWLFDLSGPPAEVRSALDAGAVALCDQHASEITVPLGWELDDRRATELDLGPAAVTEVSTTTGSTPLLERAFRVGRSAVSQ